MKHLLLIAALALVGCGKNGSEGNSEAEIENQAAALAIASNASVNAQIEALDAETNAALAAQQPANSSANSTEAAKK